jgi:type III secretion protein I
MIEAVIAQTAAPTGASLIAPEGLRAQALGADVERFAQAMQKTEVSAMPHVDTLAEAQISEKAGLGDAILSGLKSASDDLGQRFTQAQTMLSGQDLGVADAMRLQLSIMQASMQYELINKGVTKMTQNIDQVLKTQ